MPASGNSLVDANVWLALAVDAHRHHAAALIACGRKLDPTTILGRTLDGCEKWANTRRQISADIVRTERKSSPVN